MNRAGRRQTQRTRTADTVGAYIELSTQCLVASLDDCGFGVSDITQILAGMNLYIKDYTDYLNKGDYKMKDNADINLKVKEKVKILMKDGIQKAQGLRLLRNEFNLPNAQLSDLWIESKVELSKHPEKADNLLPVKTKGNDKLKVVSVVATVRGEYGTYYKSDDGVKIEGSPDISYKAKDDIVNKRLVTIEDGNKQITMLTQQIEELKAKLAQSKKDQAEKVARLKEIECVFNL